MLENVNREYKDRLFRLLFGREEYKANMLSLYNALNETEYTDPSDLTITTMEDVIYVGMKNDVSFILADYITLWEQQSSYNPNMPLRGLMYFGKLYNSYVEQNRLNIYGTTLLRIPTPKYVILYNGKGDQPETRKLKLSDAFICPDGSGEFEWTATMININPGKNDDLLNRCPILKEYMILINRIRENRDAGKNLETAIDHAVIECINDGILSDFLLKHRAEVAEVCITEFNKEVYENGIRAEGLAEGLAQGENRMVRLVDILLKAQQFDLLEKASKDKELRAKLYTQYGII